MLRGSFCALLVCELFAGAVDDCGDSVVVDDVGAVFAGFCHVQAGVACLPVGVDSDAD